MQLDDRNVQDKLNEARTLLEFLQDITVSWDLNAVQPTENSMYGLTFLLRQVSDLVKAACEKKEKE